MSSKIIFFLPETNSLCVRYLNEREVKRRSMMNRIDNRLTIGEIFKIFLFRIPTFTMHLSRLLHQQFESTLFPNKSTPSSHRAKFFLLLPKRNTFCVKNLKEDRRWSSDTLTIGEIFKIFSIRFENVCFLLEDSSIHSISIDNEAIAPTIRSITSRSPRTVH